MKAATTRRRWTVGAIGIALVLWVLLTLVGRPFRYVSVCDRCGALRRTTDWRVPLTGLEAFTRSTEHGTPLSQVLETNGIVPPHVHHWLFGHGAGNGVTCAIGQGRHLLPAATSEDFAALVLTLHRHGRMAIRDLMLRTALDPRTARGVAYLGRDAPPVTASAEELDAWLGGHPEVLERLSLEEPSR